MNSMQKTPKELLADAEARLSTVLKAFEDEQVTLTAEEVERLREELQKTGSLVGALWHQLNILRSVEN